MRENVKLFKVNLRGMRYTSSGSAPEGVSYVLANCPTSAYIKVRKRLDEKNYGFSKDRELESVELVADSYEYTDAPFKLHIGETIAYEFHNHETGHCYVDYNEREGQGVKDGYVKSSLYKL